MKPFFSYSLKIYKINVLIVHAVLVLVPYMLEACTVQRVV